MSESSGDKLWGGRFSESTDAFVEAFTASVNFDRRLYRHDIHGSMAHARMLAHVGVLTDAECDAICDGLEAIQAEIEAGEFRW
ncbi:MAG: lyase family protein, partial [Acidihalobacter sp.]